jgi:hypothetical protein
MAGQVEDGVEDDFVGDAFVADDLYELPSETLVPVSIFVISHSACKILHFRLYLNPAKPY